MTKTHFGFLSLVVILLSFSACSLEKRVYQDGYHISWNNHFFSKKNATFNNSDNTEITKTKIEVTQAPVNSETEPNVHSVETASASNTESPIFSPREKTSIYTPLDTVIPKEEVKQEEYFNNNYTAPLPTNELQDTKLANWALGLGIAAISSPVWLTLLFFLVFALVGASMSTVSVWTALALALLIGGGIFVALEVLAITFAIRFLRLHAKDPNYRKYRSRAITGLILAGIYPALTIINIILAIVLAI
jgi:hypothetical protein